MGDIRIVWDASTGTGDFNMIGPSLELGHDLETAVLISLFTDRVADPEDILPPDLANDPRGVWFDAYEAPDVIGSKLCQVFWRVRNQDTLNWVTDTILAALQWMKDDGVASAVTAAAQFYGSGGIGVVITIVQPSGARAVFSYAWQQES